MYHLNLMDTFLSLLSFIVRLNRNNCQLFAFHVVHVLKSLQESDLNCSLDVQNISSLSEQKGTFQISLGRYDFTFYDSFGCGHLAQTFAEVLGQPHVLDEQVLNKDAPLFGFLEYKLLDFFIDLLSFSQ
jgi:hypothetical protein